MVCDGLSACLTAENIDVVATATDGRDALDLGLHSRPDVAVLDASLSPLSAMDVARKLATDSSVRIVLLSSGWGARKELECARPHVHGFVSLGEPARLLAEMITRVAHGELDVPTERLHAATVFSMSGEPVRLAKKQLQVLELISHGSTSHEIAERLGIGVRTACNHRAAIMQKLGVRNVVQLVRLAIRSGLANP